MSASSVATVSGFFRAIGHETSAPRSSGAADPDGSGYQASRQGRHGLLVQAIAWTKKIKPGSAAMHPGV